MRKFKTVYMRGGTSKGLMFRREDLPEDRSEWDSIFLQAMGNPDPKQIDGVGGTVSSNNKIIVVWKSDLPGVDLEYLVGQVVVGKNQVDYRANCGNMTSAVGPFAVEDGIFRASAPVVTTRLLNRNTDKRIDTTFPVEDGRLAPEGNCKIAGIDGSAAEIQVNFLDPAGAKTNELAPTGNFADVLDIPGFGKVEVTILDISGPMVMLRASDIGAGAGETPEEINGNSELCSLLEKIRGAAATAIGMAKNPEDASVNSPSLPKIGIFSGPQSYTDMSGTTVTADEMHLCARVISVFKCHKASPLTAACAIASMALLDGTVIREAIAPIEETNGRGFVKIGHPSGVIGLYVDKAERNGKPVISGVAVQRTARRIMDGTIYIRT
ncbi:MAG: PrpF protein [Synergistaceae bacterium]|jgi:2-methylaconitate cis-trans-isomerase PrpF|nr:PrpF protein [Synergistaceae bacterium]